MNIVTAEARPHFQLTGPGHTRIETLAAFISEAAPGAFDDFARNYGADLQSVARRFDINI